VASQRTLSEPYPAPSIQVHEVYVAVPEGVGPGSVAMTVEYLGLMPDGFPLRLVDEMSASGRAACA